VFLLFISMRINTKRYSKEDSSASQFGLPFRIANLRTE
jgi:hypothetical protein